MVTLNRIYTKSGDKGETALGDGTRRPKHDLRIAAYGTVDEANAAIGIARLEREIDLMNSALKPLDSFVLPGGSPAAAYLHLARTIVRRAERLMTELALSEKVSGAAVRYANRLSDHLFVASRLANDGGAKDVLWVPGKNR